MIVLQAAAYETVPLLTLINHVNLILSPLFLAYDIWGFNPEHFVGVTRSEVKEEAYKMSNDLGSDKPLD